MMADHSYKRRLCKRTFGLNPEAAEVFRKAAREELETMKSFVQRRYSLPCWPELFRDLKHLHNRLSGQPQDSEGHETLPPALRAIESSCSCNRREGPTTGKNWPAMLSSSFSPDYMEFKMARSILRGNSAISNTSSNVQLLLNELRAAPEEMRSAIAPAYTKVSALNDDLRRVCAPTLVCRLLMLIYLSEVDNFIG
jgi:hypothetical protein